MVFGETLDAERPDALTIADLYGRVDTALARAFPRTQKLWVRGEIQHISEQGRGRGNCYIDLIDPDGGRDRQVPVLKVKCWQSTWGPVRLMLSRAGVTLAPGMVVYLRGTLDLYRPKAELGFLLQEVDVTALLGRMAAQRAALVRTLEAEGLTGRNRALPVPAVPLRIGLVASPGTEGYRDFLGQLTASGYAFSVHVAKTAVQGAGAPRSIAAAISRLGSLGPSTFDVVVVVRGGGSKGDLAAFDDEPVARAVATCAVPVWTGVGHTGDESVADIVANRSCSTPTDCGRELVTRVATFWDLQVAQRARLVGARATQVFEDAEASHAADRRRLVGMARHLLDRRLEQVAAKGNEIVRAAPRAIEEARTTLTRRGARLAPRAVGQVDRAADRVASWRRLVAAYDVDRQLERGYTLTLDAGGRVVRGISGLAPGAEILTRFSDGTARSVVAEVAAAAGLEVEERNDAG